MKVLATSILLAPATASSATAQDQQPGPHDHRFHAPYVTSGGATVDKPGEPQSSAPTSSDRKIQREDNTVDGNL